MPQRYDNLKNSGSKNPKIDSYIHLLRTGRIKKIKEQILICLETGPMTARELSEKIGCVRSSVCNALNYYSTNGIIDDTGTKYDEQTGRHVTLYSKSQEQHRSKSHEILTV